MIPSSTRKTSRLAGDMGTITSAEAQLRDRSIIDATTRNENEENRRADVLSDFYKSVESYNTKTRTKLHTFVAGFPKSIWEKTKGPTPRSNVDTWCYQTLNVKELVGNMIGKSAALDGLRYVSEKDIPMFWMVWSEQLALVQHHQDTIRRTVETEMVTSTVTNELIDKCVATFIKPRVDALIILFKNLKRAEVRYKLMHKMKDETEKEVNKLLADYFNTEYNNDVDSKIAQFAATRPTLGLDKSTEPTVRSNHEGSPSEE
jgi:hypothetical protein